MMMVRKTSIFPTTEEEIFSKLKMLKTLQYIAYPYATFRPVMGNNEMVWEENSSTSFYFKLFNIIPLGIHTIHVVRFGLKEGIYTREGNKFVPVWNHEIVIEQMDDGRTKYTDIVEIDAGWKTYFVYLWANAFYAHRQRKWIKLLQQEKLSEENKKMTIHP